MPSTAGKARKALKLDDVYSVLPDGSSWTLKKALSRKGTGPIRFRLTYHATLTQALDAYVDAVAGDRSESVADLLLALRECKRVIEGL